MTVFSNISKIKPDNNKTWKNKIFLTFDIDWAHDEIIEDCYNIIASYSVSTTWFVTHNSKFLNVLKNDKNVELGVHPNFNNLLFNNDNKSSSIVLNELLEIVQDPTSVRSHSLTQNERLIDLFRDCGLTHVSNFFLPHCSNIKGIPFYLWEKMIMIPHFWQDNVSIKMKSGFPLNENKLQSFQVYNFHPIHVYLNTTDLNIYEKTRSIHHNPNELISFRHDGYGVRSQLIQLLETCIS
jgi:hypothetical protein